MDILHAELFQVALCVLVWWLSSLASSRIGGGASLARHYRYPGRFKGERWNFQGGRMRSGAW